MTVTGEVGELEHGVEIPVAEETAFPIGSISKAWTGTLAMILVPERDNKLDAPLDEYLPKLDDLVGRLTLCQLLSHISGFADIPELSTLSPGRYVRARRCLRRTSGAGHATRLGPSGPTCCRETTSSSTRRARTCSGWWRLSSNRPKAEQPG
ncbi:MAG TPA: serine hydrolase [Pseudonocardiaceae bacterium]|nr:serine hydrolase [Pseudonocardiaceae bacterium]